MNVRPESCKRENPVETCVVAHRKVLEAKDCYCCCCRQFQDTSESSEYQIPHESG
ncbi:MAG: hypothetical protein HXS41_15075 [Theionarchaea archaeon]|nr:hypothetical protein [Theionarchaea archaeon]MBU7001902.1 hypothetical protein [Theionarchaea archaeon]MBU7022374.1 hypothetical protein [Theionarchaea archaeon]MBU7035093.1 hypothetical protein [Theionarchaea archaeon]MBU7040691.1 hypothetical protein [Theionarchaea archaeon]